LNPKIPAPDALKERIKALADAVRSGFKGDVEPIKVAFTAAMADHVYPSYIIDEVNKELKGSSMRAFLSLRLENEASSESDPKTKTATVVVFVTEYPMKRFEVTWTEL
jgi:hypothetical protein